jgi:hypothetical protein
VAKVFFVDWNRIANDTAAMLRLEASRAPHDRKLIELIGRSARAVGTRARPAEELARILVAAAAQENFSLLRSD